LQNNMKNKLLTILIIISLKSAPLFAQFVDIAIGARNTAMGNASTGLADDIYSLYSNPAGISRIYWKEIGIDFEKLYMGLKDSSDISNGFIGYITNLKQYGTVGTGMINFSLSGYYKENTYLLSYGNKLPGSRLFGGISLKILSKEYGSTLYTENAANLNTGFTRNGRDPVFINGYSKQGMDIDLGILYDINGYHTIGIAVTNLLQADMGLLESDKIPSKIKLGYAYKTNSNNIAADLVLNKSDININTGIEKWFFGKTIAVRGGIGIGSREYVDISFGAGWLYNRLMQIDYSFNYPLRGISEFYGSHKLSLTYKFNVPEQAIKQSVQSQDDLFLEIEILKKKLEETNKAAEETKKQAEETEQEKETINAELGKIKYIYEKRIKSLEQDLLNQPKETKREIIEKYWNKGIEYFNNEEYLKAINEFETLLKIDPKHDSSIQRIKLIKEKLAATNTKLIEKYYSDGLKQYYEGNLTRAIELWESALQLNPYNEEIKTVYDKAKREYEMRKK